MNCCEPGFLSFTISLTLLKLMSIESVMPSSSLILSHPLLLLPSIFPSTRPPPFFLNTDGLKVHRNISILNKYTVYFFLFQHLVHYFIHTVPLVYHLIHMYRCVLPIVTITVHTSLKNILKIVYFSTGPFNLHYYIEGVCS